MVAVSKSPVLPERKQRTILDVLLRLDHVGGARGDLLRDVWMTCEHVDDRRYLARGDVCKEVSMRTVCNRPPRQRPSEAHHEDKSGSIKRGSAKHSKQTNDRDRKTHASPHPAEAHRLRVTTGHYRTPQGALAHIPYPSQDCERCISIRFARIRPLRASESEKERKNPATHSARFTNSQVCTSCRLP